jgi:large subunit ribosomal protein L25
VQGAIECERTVSHVEFFKVNLNEKLKTQIPVRIIGEAPAVKEGTGTLLTTLGEVEIEALPTNIPEGLDLDVSGLTAVNMELKVKDLGVPSGVSIVTDPELWEY